LTRNLPHDFTKTQYFEGPSPKDWDKF
jgi:hypothetical protein